MHKRNTISAFFRQRRAIVLIPFLLIASLGGCGTLAYKSTPQMTLLPPSASDRQTLEKDFSGFAAEPEEVPDPLPHEPEPSQTEQAADEPTANAAVEPQPAGLSQLQQTLQNNLQSYGGTWSVYVKRLDTGESFAINDSPMVAASLIKLYVYGAIGAAVESGQVAGGTYDATLSSMITVSDNAACNLLIDVLGMGAMNQFILDQGYTMTTLNRKMLSGEPVENYTSVSDCGRLLEQVYNGAFVCSDTSGALLNDLQNQTRRWKIPAGLPSGTLCANKTGELSDVENDVAIVYGPSCTYILCVMSDGISPGTAQANIQSISSTVYHFFND